jgi:hypothetical protein
MSECVIAGQVTRGVMSPSGLRNGGRITLVALNAVTWTALPPTPLTDRNAMCIQNISGVEIRLQYDSATVGYVGVVIASGSERFYDITDTIMVYAKSSAGAPVIVIEEIS